MKKLVLLAPVSALLLAGCAHDPTVAAKVGSHTIAVSDVSIVADYLCVGATQGQQVVPMSQINELATTYLAGASALEDLATRSHVTIPPANSDQEDPLVAKLPSGERSRATALVKRVNAAANFYAQQGASGQQILSQFATLIATEAKAGRFTSNPAYPTIVGGSAGSLSTAVSAAAKSAAQPDKAYLAALPAGQKCG